MQIYTTVGQVSQAIRAVASSITSGQKYLVEANMGNISPCLRDYIKTKCFSSQMLYDHKNKLKFTKITGSVRLIALAPQNKFNKIKKKYLCCKQNLVKKPRLSLKIIL